MSHALLSDMVAALLLFGVVTYSVFGGADFGAGFWDLVAGGADRGAQPRRLIEQSIAPVWEANHVWLIFCLVVLWSGFSEVFSAVMSTLYEPLTLAAFGIVLRGASFAFRKEVLRTRDRRNFGAAFALSSLLVPFCMGAVAGSIASGRVEVEPRTTGRWSTWINPTSMVGGTLAVVVCAYLAAVYLASDARRLGDATMNAYFRRRAIASAVVTGAVAIAGIFVLHADAPYLFHGLTSRALPLVVASGIGGLGSVVLLIRHRDQVARVAAVGAVATVIVAWGVAQWPYMLPRSAPVSDVAAPSGTLEALLVVFVVAAVTIVPAFALLFVLDQKSVLGDTGEHGSSGAAPKQPA